MGFISNDNEEEIKIVAKLTPYGREQVIKKSINNVVRFFSLGDSEANYHSPLSLGNGEIPTIGGNVSSLLSMSDGYEIRNKIIVDALGNTNKTVETNSTNVNLSKERLGQKTITSDKIQQFLIKRGDFNVDNKTNLLYGLGLPVTENDITLFNKVLSKDGGFSDTALRTLNNNNVLVLSIDSDEYGEMIDGKSINISLQTLLTNFSIYGTYQNNQTPKRTQDTKVREITTKSNQISNNIVFLFSDKIKRPNNDATKSWSTGFGKSKPFSVNGKSLFNLTDNVSSGAIKDECVGVAYLDKGIIVITHPTIANNYDVDNFTAQEVKISFNSIITKVSQDITCIKGRGEFIKSTNKTYNENDDIRVSEIGIYDVQNKLVALAKPSQHIVIGNNDFKAFGIKISV